MHYYINRISCGDDLLDLLRKWDGLSAVTRAEIIYLANRHTREGEI